MAEEKSVMAENGQPTFEGLSQYCPPRCFELAGRELTLCMDSGYDYTLRFERDTVTWGKVGEEPRTDEYVCLKAEEQTYFVNAEIPGVEPRLGLTLILDDENALVTVIEGRQGMNPKFPFLVEIHAHFGAVQLPGKPLNSKRHGYTTDLVGKAAIWTYSPDFRVVHAYTTERYYNVTVPEALEPGAMRERREPSPEDLARMESFRGYLDPTEPALYIRIKDGIYVFAFAEQNLELRTGPNTRGNSLAFLMNFRRMYDVGRSFGTNAQQQPENYCFGAYGKEIPFPEHFKTLKSAYYT